MKWTIFNIAYTVTEVSIYQTRKINIQIQGRWQQVYGTYSYC